jgi:hypothetical protein
MAFPNSKDTLMMVRVMSGLVRKTIPVSFGVEHKALLYHAKFMLENRYVQIHPTMDKLITALRSSWAREGILDKEVTSHHDIIDAFRLCLRSFKEQSTAMQ